LNKFFLAKINFDKNSFGYYPHGMIIGQEVWFKEEGYGEE
jgi:hypothetical protein